MLHIKFIIKINYDLHILNCKHMELVGTAIFTKGNQKAIFVFL